MNEAQGNIWLMKCDRIAITMSGTVTNDGNAVMLRGISRQAKDQFPSLPGFIGAILQVPTLGNHVWALPFGLVMFPTKEDWKEKSKLSIIQRSAHELVAMADKRGWSKVVMPRPGVGNNGLLWHDVKKVLIPILDSRFTVVTYPSK